MNYLKAFLSEFDFVLPKGKMHFEKGKMIEKIQYYLVPLLFPYKKPSKIVLFNGKISNFKRNHQWNIKYLLPFKPSSIWKILFLKLRISCIGNYTKNKQEERMIDGEFLFFLKKK